MNPPTFTQEQQDWICYQIGEWYLQWKHNIVDDGVKHRLGYAKEQLKEMICPSDEILQMIDCVEEHLKERICNMHESINKPEESSGSGCSGEVIVKYIPEEMPLTE